MNTFNVAQPLPALKRTTVIEASAGTGKTWMIAALAVRYVAEGRATIDQILIVTFTRLATSELKDRIRMRFVEVHRELVHASRTLERTGHADSLVAALLAGISAEELTNRIERLQRAIGEFDQATISTIHGFCQSVLTGLGISHGVAPLENLNTELSELNSEIAHDVFLRQYMFKKNEGFTWNLAQSAVHKIVEEPSTALLKPEPSPRDEASTPAEDAYEFAIHARVEFIRRIRERNITTYSDFLELLKEAVGQGDTGAAAVLRHRWPVVLVDEFQDTDPTQWHIFKHSFHEHSALILIGDPKQAIYGFRGADIYTYTHAVAQAHEQYTLATNFRSTPSLIESFNEIWGGAQLGENIIARDVTARPQAAARDVQVLKSGSVLAPFQVRVPAHSDVAEAQGTSAGEQQRAVTADLTHLIYRMINEATWGSGSAPGNDSRVRPQDFAVLCASNSQCETVARTLRAAAIPVSYASGSVGETAAAVDLYWLLNAMVNPSRQNVIHRVALSPFFGYEPAELLDETTADQVATHIGDWNRLLTEVGLGAVIEAATAQGLATHAVNVREGERYLSDLRHLAELSREAGLRSHDGPELFLAWLTGDLLEAGGERVLDVDGGAVRVLTIHQAKGLQFPIVLLPFSSFGGKALSAPYHVYDPTDQTRKIALTDIGDSRNQAITQGSDERLRTWYVATTRAQSHVITWCMPYWPNRPHPAQQLILIDRKPGEPRPTTTAKKSDWAGIFQALSRWKHTELAQFTWTFDRPRLSEYPQNPEPHSPDPQNPEPQNPEPQNPEQLTRARPFTRKIDRGWRRTSYSGLSAEAERRQEWSRTQLSPLVDSEADQRIDPLEARTISGIADAGSAGPDGKAHVPIASPMANLPKGNRFGSLVHDILEHLDPGQPNFPEQLPQLVSDCLKLWPVTMEPEQISQLCEALEAVCKTPLGPLFSGVTLADLGAANRLPELPFDMPLAGGLNASTQYGRPNTLAAIAALLREHLEPGDPILPYAEELEQDAYASTVLQGYLTGSIDAVLRHKNSYIVVDYKTNWLGGFEEPLTLDHYGPEELQQAMNGSSYPLQALLYAVAAHRFLRWRIADYDPKVHLGGVAYLYLRGMGGPETPITGGEVHGVFSWKPPAILVEKLSDLLDANTTQHPRNAPAKNDGEV